MTVAGLALSLINGRFFAVQRVVKVFDGGIADKDRRDPNCWGSALVEGRGPVIQNTGEGRARMPIATRVIVSKQGRQISPLISRRLCRLISATASRLIDPPKKGGEIE